MWQASLLAADRKIFQTGQGLDERADRILVDLTDEKYAEIKAALAEPNGGVRLAADGALTVLPPPPEPEPPLSEAAGLLEMAGTIDPGGNTAIAEMSVLIQAFAAVAQARGW